MTDLEEVRSVELIRWHDTHSQTGGWMELARVIQEMTAAPIALTIGWVLHEDEDQVLVAASHFTDWSQVGDTIAILKVQIIERLPVTLPSGPVLGAIETILR